MDVRRANTSIPASHSHFSLIAIRNHGPVPYCGQKLTQLGVWQSKGHTSRFARQVVGIYTYIKQNINVSIDKDTPVTGESSRTMVLQKMLPESTTATSTFNFLLDAS